MIELLQEHKGKVVILYLKGIKDYFPGIVDKLLYDNTVLRMHNNHRYIFIAVDQISALLDKGDDELTGKFDDHVVPNAFN